MENGNENIREKLEKEIEIVEKDKSILFIYKNSQRRGDFDFINTSKMINVKVSCQDLEKYSEDKNWANSVVVEFDTICIDKDYIYKVYEHQEKLLVNKKFFTYADALRNTFEYFANEISKSFKNKLMGDIGEAIFILKTFDIAKQNIINNFHKNDNDLYDFSFNEKSFIEVKSTTLDKNEIVLTNCQADYVNNKNFVVIKYKTIPKSVESMNIIDLYDRIKNEIGILCENLNEKYQFYQEINEINEFSINLDKVHIGVLADESVPVFETKDNAAIKKVKFYLDVTDNLNNFEKFIKDYKFSN